MRDRICRALAVALLAAAGVPACASPRPSPDDTSPADTDIRGGTPVVSAPVAKAAAMPGLTGDQAWDRSVMEQLERDARRLVKADGCRDVADCRTAPVGVKACGGPRDYILYCASGTDSVALFTKLDQLARHERAFNQRYQAGSTCDIRSEPTVALVGQSCRAAP